MQDLFAQSGTVCALNGLDACLFSVLLFLSVAVLRIKNTFKIALDSVQIPLPPALVAGIQIIRVRNQLVIVIDDNNCLP